MTLLLIILSSCDAPGHGERPVLLAVRPHLLQDLDLVGRDVLHRQHHQPLRNLARQVSEPRDDDGADGSANPFKLSFPQNHNTSSSEECNMLQKT